MRLEDIKDPKQRALFEAALKKCPQPNQDETHHRRQIPDAKPERHKAPALDGAVPGKTESVPRVKVRFIGCRVRPLDPDGFAGSVKDLLDGLRHSGLIPGDEPWRIRLETEQVKVEHYSEEVTIIEIEPLP